MFLTINNEVILRLKSPNDVSCPPLLLNVSWRERTVCASSLRIMWPPWYFIISPAAMTNLWQYSPLLLQPVILWNISRSSIEVLYGKFTWGIIIQKYMYSLIWSLALISKCSWRCFLLFLLVSSLVTMAWCRCPCNNNKRLDTSSHCSNKGTRCLYAGKYIIERRIMQWSTYFFLMFYVMVKSCTLSN